MCIDMELWLGLTLRSLGRVCEIRSQVAHVQLLANTHEIHGVVARYGNKKRRFAMVLCFGGTVLVLLFYVRGSKVWHAQSRNPLEMPVSTSSVHFPYLRNKGGWQWRQLRPEWKPQHRSGKSLQEVATPTCCEACEPCDLLWKLTLTSYIYITERYGVANIPNTWSRRNKHSRPGEKVYVTVSTVVPDKLELTCRKFGACRKEQWIW